MAAQRSLSAAEADGLLAGLRADAREYYYSACITIASALIGMNSQMYTWATVQVYYAVFYALRARLALDGICIYYVSTSAFSIFAAPGEQGHQTKENTHKSVLRAFEHQYGGDVLLSQTIGVAQPLDWLMERREEANYKVSPFPEPSAPKHFNELERYGLRKLITAYLADTSDRFTFDEDHAILAYPIRALRGTLSTFVSTGGPPLTDVELATVKGGCRDAAGILTQLVKAITGV